MFSMITSDFWDAIYVICSQKNNVDRVYQLHQVNEHCIQVNGPSTLVILLELCKKRDDVNIYRRLARKQEDI